MCTSPTNTSVYDVSGGPAYESCSFSVSKLKSVPQFRCNLAKNEPETLFTQLKRSALYVREPFSKRRRNSQIFAALESPASVNVCQKTVCNQEREQNKIMKHIISTQRLSTLILTVLRKQRHHFGVHSWRGPKNTKSTGAPSKFGLGQVGWHQSPTLVVC